MPRPERFLDPAAGPVESLAAELRKLRSQAGNPGYRELAERSGYSMATLANAAAGRQLPTLAVTLAFVRACDGEPVEWERRWRQTAAESRTSRSRSPHDNGDARVVDVPPYRGLESFDVDHAEFFFGRQRIVGQLVSTLDERRFLAVFGVSGSGKSSPPRPSGPIGRRGSWSGYARTSSPGASNCQGWPRCWRARAWRSGR